MAYAATLDIGLTLNYSRKDSMYIVEIYTTKEVWEVQLETPRQGRAVKVWQDCMADGYSARITYNDDTKQLLDQLL